MKITLKQSHGWRRFWRTMIRPEIYDRLIDDNYAPPRTGWGRALSALGISPRGRVKRKVRALLSNPANRVYEVRVDGKFAGCFVLLALGGGVFEEHTLFLKEFHGLFAVRIGRAATRQILSLPDINKLVSLCPENLPETYLFAKLCGWKFAGMHPNKWVKNGVAYAMRQVEITKGDLCYSVV